MSSAMGCGELPLGKSSLCACSCSSKCSETDSIFGDATRFWELELLPYGQSQDVGEAKCEGHCDETDSATFVASGCNDETPFGCCRGCSGEERMSGASAPGVTAHEGDVASLSIMRAQDGMILHATGVVLSRLVSGANQWMVQWGLLRTRLEESDYEKLMCSARNKVMHAAHGNGSAARAEAAAEEFMAGRIDFMEFLSAVPTQVGAKGWKSCNFGLLKARGRDYAATWESMPKTTSVLARFVKERAPANFVFDVMTLALNGGASWHRDTGNHGCSFLITFGGERDYLVLQSESGAVSVIPTYWQGATFRPVLLHSTVTMNERRFSLAAYSRGAGDIMQRAELNGAGFRPTGDLSPTVRFVRTARFYYDGECKVWEKPTPITLCDAAVVLWKHLALKPLSFGARGAPVDGRALLQSLEKDESDDVSVYLCVEDESMGDLECTDGSIVNVESCGQDMFTLGADDCEMQPASPGVATVDSSITLGSLDTPEVSSVSELSLLRGAGFYCGKSDSDLGDVVWGDCFFVALASGLRVCTHLDVSVVVQVVQKLAEVLPPARLCDHADAQLALLATSLRSIVTQCADELKTDLSRGLGGSVIEAAHLAFILQIQVVIIDSNGDLLACADVVGAKGLNVSLCVQFEDAHYSVVPSLCGARRDIEEMSNLTLLVKTASIVECPEVCVVCPTPCSGLPTCDQCVCDSCVTCQHDVAECRGVSLTHSMTVQPKCASVVCPTQGVNLMCTPVPCCVSTLCVDSFPTSTSESVWLLSSGGPITCDEFPFDGISVDILSDGYHSQSNLDVLSSDEYSGNGGSDARNVGALLHQDGHAEQSVIQCGLFLNVSLDPTCLLARGWYRGGAKGRAAKDPTIDQVMSSGANPLEKALQLSWPHAKAFVKRATLKQLLAAQDDWRLDILQCTSRDQVSKTVLAKFPKLEPAQGRADAQSGSKGSAGAGAAAVAKPASEKGPKSASSSGWQDATVGAESVVEQSLDPKEWAVPTTQRLCMGKDCAALVEAKDIAKLRERFRGVPNRIIAVGAGAVPENESNAVEIAYHVTKVWTVGADTKKEVVAVRGWKLELGTAPPAQDVEVQAPSVKLDTVASRLCAIDLPKQYTPEADWAALLGGKRSIVRDKLRAAWINDAVKFEEAVLDVFKLSRVGDQMSMLARIAEQHVDAVFALSGKGGLFVRPMGNSSAEYHVVWYEKDETLEQVSQRASDVGAAGVAFSKGKLGVRCKLADRDRVFSALGKTHTIQWLMSGLPTDASVDAACAILKHFVAAGSKAEVVSTSRRLIAGRPAFVVKVPADETLACDMVCVERTVGAEVLKMWVVLSKLEARKVHRQVFLGKSDATGSDKPDSAVSSSVSRPLPVVPPIAPQSASGAHPSGDGQAVKRRFTETGPSVMPPPPPPTPLLDPKAVELMVNSAIQASFARMEAIVVAQEARFTSQMEDIHRVAQENGALMQEEEHLDMSALS
eukprot:6293649-Amphidinium_carterae.1